MKQSIQKRILFSLLVFIYGSSTAQELNVDLCVYGSTSAGIIGAYSAAKLGKSVVIIDPGTHIGGLTTGGLGYTDIGNKYAITGLSREFYRKIGKQYGAFEQWIFEPHVAENIFRDYIRSAKLKLIQQAKPGEVNKTGNSIRSVSFQVKNNRGVLQTVIVKARAYLDCSYEGDLMAKAGVSYTVGREPNSQYGETYNGVQLMKGHQFPDGIDPYKIKGNAQSGLLWGISNAALQPDGTGDTLVQAYNYRICLTNDAANRIAITRPEGYDPSRYDLLARLIEAQPGKLQLSDYFIWSKMPNNKTDINNRHGFSTDMIGMNYNYPNGNDSTRNAFIRQLTAYTKGLLYFFGHDTRVPPALREQMLQWGYPKDEYKAYGNWSPQPYIREARRMVGAYVMTEANCTGKEVVEDGIGLAAYTMDSHNTQRIVWNGMVKNEGNVEIGGGEPYPIAYRAILPKETECNNLLVPVCLSASHIAYGSIRMEPVFMVLAQSAAVAASLSLDQKIPLHQVKATAIRQVLESDPLLDGSKPEVLVDNDGPGVETTGAWKRQAKSGYGKSLLLSETNSSTPGSVKFYPSLNDRSEYRIFTYYTHLPNQSRFLEYVVFDGERSRQGKVDVSTVQVVGQTTGEWIELGKIIKQGRGKPYVEIIAQPGQGPTVADAVLFVTK